MLFKVLRSRYVHFFIVLTVSVSIAILYTSKTDTKDYRASVIIDLTPLKFEKNEYIPVLEWCEESVIFDELHSNVFLASISSDIIVVEFSHSDETIVLEAAHLLARELWRDARLQRVEALQKREDKLQVLRQAADLTLQNLNAANSVGNSTLWRSDTQLTLGVGTIRKRILEEKASLMLESSSLSAEMSLLEDGVFNPEPWTYISLEERQKYTLRHLLNVILGFVITGLLVYVISFKLLLYLKQQILSYNPRKQEGV